MTTKPLASNLSAPLPAATQPSRSAERGMYLPSERDRAMYLPSDERRAAPPRGTERGIPFPYDDNRAALQPSRDAEQYLLQSDHSSRPQLSRVTEHGMRLPSDNHEGLPLMLSRGTERGGIFLTSDDHSLARQVEQLHNPDARNVNIRPLFLLVQDIIEHATQTVDGISLNAISQKEPMNPKFSLDGFQEVPELPLIVERISCEITSKVLSGVDAHNTTLSVLSMLQHFSWEAKVVLSLAAFALTFGDFWLLVQIYSTNSLAKSMALIKRLPMMVEHEGGFKNQFEATNVLIRAMLETIKCMVEFGELPTVYITAEDPEVKAAISHFPIAVYWVIRSAVAAATHITTLSSRGLEYGTATSQSWELSNWAHKLKNISDHLRNTLSKLYHLIGEKRDVDTYNMIRKIVYQTIHIDNMKVLYALISANDDVPPLYDGPAKRRVHLDTLRRKNVLLLISGLDITQEELFILEQSYTESKVHSYDIVWIPVVDHSVEWSDMMQAKLENLQATMPWYSVHHPSLIRNAVVKFFREDWHFRGKPILVVLDPQGKVVSPNAIHMMWIWQNNAFPFTSTREENLWEQETWRLELLVNGIDPKILDWIRDGKYIFIYGGDDIEWIRKFTREAHAVARALQVSMEMVYVGRSHNKELVRKVGEAIMVEQLSHCWQDPTQVWYFWTRIESMIFSKIQLGRVHDHGDVILQEIQRIHSHDKSHGGWAILAKGSTIMVHGQGKLVLFTLQELELWKEKALNDGFEVGYGNHYRELHRKEFPCHRIEFPATIRVPQSMLCPDCRRHMKNFNSFICCHEDAIGGSEFAPALEYAEY
ncbi:protein SIEVE ELEMENT OCCLUSION B [Beta vulgaris subsp. vulgaris]|uniref:protein SIEVE ELEMENT OCCLUSION B n=1 Tax=Beta vulgaris subsp. vulgaris TaxID=3555 RepID=UPI002036D767|nr:protein SIEVE ELEMENT OCCLUSION B [Beta vulgaris subsp. vulgaris]